MSKEGSMRVALLNEVATLPKRATQDSAGYDLYSCERRVIHPHQRALIATGISIDLPAGCYGRIASRSGLAWKHAIDVGAGVIDPGYTGELKVLLFNESDVRYEVNIGDRIAQLICERFATPDVLHVLATDDRNTERLCNGFGSSGK